MKRIEDIAGALLTLVMLAGVVAGALTLTAAPAQAATTPASAPLCASEDSHGPCYWDARHQGNHRGLSFWVTPKGQYVYEQRWTRSDGTIASNWTLVCPSNQHVTKFRWGVKCA